MVPVSPVLSSPVPFLVSYGKTIPGICPARDPYLLVRVDDPSVSFWAGCDSYQCLVCGPRKTFSVAAALGYWSAKQPIARFMTLTLAPSDGHARRQKMNKLSYLAKKEGLDWRVCWTTEVGSKTGMVHIHAIHIGDKVPTGWLNATWGARTEVKKIQTTGGAVSGYMAKGAAAARYMAKGAGEASYAHHLQLNEGRPFRWSRAFWNGQTWEEVLREARMESNAGEVFEWRQGTREEMIARMNQHSTV